jgi:hypothetical protein
MRWYGVRTLLRLVARGTPKKLDKHFDPASTLVEDRIVLFKADSFEAAIKQAEQEARAYCQRTRYINLYGQSVRMRLLSASDVFSLLDNRITSGCEVYSSTALAHKSVSDASVVRERFGRLEMPGAPTRYKFIDGGILKKALKATGLSAPIASSVRHRKHRRA